MADIKNSDSILNSVKLLLGIVPTYFDFDDQVILYINTVFSKLHQLGVGPDDGFEITDETTIWSDYLKNNKILNMVKTYMAMNVKMMFDPPQSSFAMQSLKEAIEEYGWRINVQVDPGRKAT